VANRANADEISRIADAVSERTPVRACAEGARRAAEHYLKLNHASLAAQIARVLTEEYPA
jgi:hypothetical protein